LKSNSPKRLQRSERAEAIVLVLILVAIVAAIVWWLVRSRQESEEQAKGFALEVATRLAVDLDRKYFDRVIAPERVAKYPPSFRDRVIEKFRGFGRPTAPVDVEGDVIFASVFFKPSGTFRVKLNYPQMPAVLYLMVSRPKGWWQIDEMNISWTPPAGTQAPTELLPAEPTAPPPR
jgi:hypothetical protein